MLLFRFHGLWSRAGAKGFAGKWYDGIYNAYSAPYRRYHTLNHLSECFSEFDEVKDLLNDPVAVEFAIWYHDLIYHIDKPGSEEESAKLAGKLLAEGGLGVELQDKVMGYIRATANHTIPTDDMDQRYFLDIDLAILGQEEARFEEFERQIREEYAWVPEEIYNFERAKILGRFLEGPIYKTTHFRDKYEARARINLPRSIARLKL